MDRKQVNIFLALLIVVLLGLLVWVILFTGGSEIHVAAAQGNLADAKSLLAEKPELVNVRDRDGWTALHVAADANQNKMVALLLVSGADVNAKTLKKRRWGYSKKEYGWTALHMAANAGNNQMAELLFANGAEVNAKTNVGHTPLHMTCIGGHKEMVELLLANGAEVSAITDDGRTPLKYSVVMGHDGISDLLRKHDRVE